MGIEDGSAQGHIYNASCIFMHGRHCSLIVEVKPIGGCSPNLSNVADTAEVICQELVSFPDLDTVGSDRVMGLDPFGSSWVVKFKIANLSSLMSLCQTSNLLSLHPSNRLPILPISVGTFRILSPRQEVKAEVKAIGSGPKISDLSVRLPSPSKLFERNHGQFLPGYRSARPQRREAFRRVVQACIKDTILFLGLRDKHRVVAGDSNLEPHAIRDAVDCVIEQFEGASYEVLHGDRSAEICCVLLNFAKLPQLRGAVKSAVAERWTSQELRLSQNDADTHYPSFLNFRLWSCVRVTCVSDPRKRLPGRIGFVFHLHRNRIYPHNHRPDSSSSGRLCGCTLD